MLTAPVWHFDRLPLAVSVPATGLDQTIFSATPGVAGLYLAFANCTVANNDPGPAISPAYMSFGILLNAGVVTDAIAAVNPGEYGSCTVLWTGYLQVGDILKVNIGCSPNTNGYNVPHGYSNWGYIGLASL